MHANSVLQFKKQEGNKLKSICIIMIVRHVCTEQAHKSKYTS